MRRTNKLLIPFLSLIILLILTACEISVKFTINYVVDNNKTITAKYEKGTVLTETQINNDSAYVLENKKRAGWYYDNEYQKSVSFPYEVNENKTLYLKWDNDEIKYNIIFYVDGEEYENIIINENELLTKPTNPEKINYEFLGWFDSSYEIEFDFNTPIKSDINLFAKWKNVTPYTVKFYSNGTIYDTQEIIKGNKAIKPTDPTNENKIFLGWFDSSYSNEFDFNSPINLNLNLYAKWQDETKYTINYKDGSDILKTVEQDAYTTIENYTPTKDGYSFKGWYTDQTLTKEFDFTTKVTKNINLYAKWIQNKFNIKYMDGSTTLKTITVDADKKLESYVPTKEHYTFDKWYTNSNLTTEFNNETLITKDYILYAKWNIDTFKVNYYVGKTLYKTEYVNYNTYANGPTTNPSKEGYAFEGWYTDEDLTKKYTFKTTKITEDLDLYANFEEFDNISISSYAGYNEGIYVTLPDSGISTENYTISYSIANANDYKEIDNELIRIENNKIRADILGLTPESYDVKIEVSGLTEIIKNITVSSQDRSGYAHFNYTTGVGAYKDDGTLKKNTVVVYVTDATKNTVKATINGKTYTGLVSILQAQKNSSNPLDIRILDMIKTLQWNSKKYSSGRNTQALVNEIIASYNNATSSSGRYYAAELLKAGANSYSNDEALGITQLNGLTSWGSSTDSYWNMCDVQNASNVTVEGVGENAGIFQWGFTWKNCKSIEVRNLTFDSYTEDACSAEGAEDSTTIAGFTYGRIWIHNNTFTKGVNRWDVSDDQDKYDGDGATDFKKLAYVTLSYNHYIKNHKTGLVGGGDTQKTACITFHHNYYDQCSARLPFVRQANVHMYNNYYYASTGNNMQIYAGAYAFIENCYFKGIDKTFIFSTSDGKVPAVKSYNNIYDNCKAYDGATIVTDRTETVTNDNIYGNTFDTNSLIFYYDSANKVTSVQLMNRVDEIPTIIPEFAGAGSNYYKSILTDNTQTKYTITLMNGNETFKTIKVNENNAANQPTTYPTSSDGVFDTWVDKDDNEFNWETLINEDITLYAKYKSKPTYETLKTDTNAIINEDFNNSTANQTLTQFSDINNIGIFGNTNGSDYSKANAIYTGSAVKTVDNDSTAAGEIYVSFGQEYTSGIVKGWVELNVGPNLGSKWALLSFYSGNQIVNFKIGADSNKYLSYAVGSTQLENGTALINTEIVKNTTYKIYYEFNLNAGTTTLIIDGTTYLNNELTNIKSLAGFYTMTNGSGTGDAARVITLDNIIVIKEN